MEKHKKSPESAKKNELKVKVKSSPESVKVMTNLSVKCIHLLFC